MCGIELESLCGHERRNGGSWKKKKAVFTDGAYVTVVVGISTLTLVHDHVIFLLLLYYPQCSHIAHTLFLVLFTPSLFLFILPPCPSLLLFLTLCFFFNQTEHIILLINTHKFILYSIVSENMASYLQLNI